VLRCYLLLSLFVVGGSLLYLGSLPASEATSNFTVYSPVSSPFGYSYGEWTGKWWDYFTSMEANASHPFNDLTGAECGRNQHGPTFFLVGSSKIPVERTCTIPYGKAILIPTINNECSTAEDPTLKSESDLRNCAVSNASFFKNMMATIDGISISDIEKYNVVSPVFNLTFPTKNPIFTAKPGVTNAVSAGNWIFIDDLPPGPHEIHVKGQSVDFTEGSTRNFAQDVTYRVNVSQP
jgi:hypothetical protein